MNEKNTELKPWQEGFRFGSSMFLLMGIIAPIVNSEALVFKQVLIGFFVWSVVGFAWVFIASPIMAMDKKRELAKVKENPQPINEEEIEENWWLEGLVLGGIFFILMGILFPLIAGYGLTLKKILIATLLFVVYGLGHGRLVYFFRQMNKEP